jgi:hypothetical protein
MDTLTNPLPSLRATAQRLADEFREAAFVVLDQPPSIVGGFQSHTPYVVLRSQSNVMERRAATERVEPKAASERNGA